MFVALLLRSWVVKVEVWEGAFDGSFDGAFEVGGGVKDSVGSSVGTLLGRNDGVAVTFLLEGLTLLDVELDAYNGDLDDFKEGEELGLRFLEGTFVGTMLGMEVDTWVGRLLF